MLRGDYYGVKREKNRLISARGNSKVVTVQDISEDNGQMVLKVANVEVYGTESFSLMDSGAIPNFLSEDLVYNLSLIPHETHNNITVATGVKSPVVGILKVVPLKFGEIVVCLDFLVVYGSPFD